MIIPKAGCLLDIDKVVIDLVFESRPNPYLLIFEMSVMYCKSESVLSTRNQKFLGTTMTNDLPTALTLKLYIAPHNHTTSHQNRFKPKVLS